jgi:hypothetical protein
VTTLKLSDPDLRDLLIAHLTTRIDLIVEPIDDGTIEVSLLGSYGPEAMRLAIDLRVRAWEVAQRAAGRTVHVELV